ncbi:MULTISPECIES: hydrolase [unclassified Rhizobium]|uniref:hydrolase n=1 Tax=unclassified Rhizobium TaxID=2613769 RepID=UPI001ADA4E28|nr:MULTISPECIES: hydrolase [unclassified Rhizobium]MBO9102174.1 hydrolase [Rhizobium sp. L58/93]MBO9171895.1 hydrolase [Rhizobium sp. L245/93]MBO9186447.1 hydrolase [Rhizobium sp. E27B/91]QXZ87199.1 hydrolase [Rhizobium sp. K1/93]QXZ92768.1 hydrolase [Rhizobium sp. K15/93]
MIYFTADTHFADRRVLNIDRRPFLDLAAHDAALVENWNGVVGNDDEVWHLGDFMSSRGGDCDQILEKLNGRKRLIIGNNDPESVLSASRWTDTLHYAEIEVDGQLLVLCHFPFRTWNKVGKKSINLHGHSHGRLQPLPRQYDVGVDAQGFHPRLLSELLAKTARSNSAS